MTFRIGYFRNQKNLSARELSLRLGKSPTYINQIKSRNFNLSLPALLDIIDVLEISCAEFLRTITQITNKTKKSSIF
ncbi:MAG: helix-turn-helix transcriptional regulator [Clostridia bacterium]|nr:helix-turn-helix transcriptional regulator [Clostridia bacterium]